jgi:hypothetical protein
MFASFQWGLHSMPSADIWANFPACQTFFDDIRIKLGIFLYQLVSVAFLVSWEISDFEEKDYGKGTIVILKSECGPDNLFQFVDGTFKPSKLQAVPL